jgi:predicted nuclease of restriction endonuclease-like (RecB) superfamily
VSAKRTLSKVRPARARAAWSEVRRPPSAARLDPPDAAFAEVLRLIEDARGRAYQAVNTALIDLYWQVGATISAKLSAAEWGDRVVDQLASYLARTQPGLQGFTQRNLFRMREFYETYRGEEKVAPLVRQISWTHNLIIMGQCKRAEERAFYLRLAIREQWSKRELERQLRAALFERMVLSKPIVSPAVTLLPSEAALVFKDAYVLEFLDLPRPHSEADLHRGLVEHLKQFLVELGRDFCFVGSHYPLQVGRRDFELDLLFFHRGINSLVAIELKVDRFEPEHLGKLEFYLEALDRDVKKPHERPSIGVLLCASKDREVVEYALSRSLSPALVAEYQTQLPEKALLQAKLHEFYALLAPERAAGEGPGKGGKSKKKRSR